MSDGGGAGSDSTGADARRLFNPAKTFSSSGDDLKQNVRVRRLSFDAQMVSAGKSALSKIGRKLSFGRKSGGRGSDGSQRASAEEQASSSPDAGGEDAAKPKVRRPSFLAQIGRKLSFDNGSRVRRSTDSDDSSQRQESRQGRRESTTMGKIIMRKLSFGRRSLVSKGDDAARNSSASGSGGGGGGGSFGVDLEALRLEEDRVSGLRIPAVLCALWGELSSRPIAEGLASEGIFRLSAMAGEVAEVKRGCEDGDGRDALKGASSQCIAALIKAFLRELPTDLWAGARQEITELDRSGQLAQVVADGDGEGGDGAAGGGSQEAAAAAPPEGAHDVAARLVAQLSPACADLVVWVCTVMAAVLKHEEANRMNVGAIATVFAPGLVHPPDGATDPSSFMVWSQIGHQLTTLLLRAHVANRLRRLRKQTSKRRFYNVPSGEALSIAARPIHLLRKRLSGASLSSGESLTGSPVRHRMSVQDFEDLVGTPDPPPPAPN